MGITMFCGKLNMRYSTLIRALVCLMLIAAPLLHAQFTADELSARSYWEDFLRTAKIIKAEQPWSEQEAVTRPWKLSLNRDGITRYAIWKNCQGLMNGFQENWRWEVAAYRLDKQLGLNMVPPTVERRFRGERGSLQLWVESEMDLREKIQRNIETPIDKSENWLRAAWLQQAFDNLIGNEDRHMGNVLVTKDFRAILIDHSRTFRTSQEFTDALIYGQEPEDPMTMRELPRIFVERLRQLNYAILHEIAEKYLTEEEIQAVLTRRELLLDWLDAHFQLVGKDNALY